MATSSKRSRLTNTAKSEGEFDFDTGTKHLDHVTSLIDGFQKSTVVVVAAKLQIFNELTGGPVGAATVAKKKGWKKDMTSRLLNSLVAMELVNKTQTGKKEAMYSLAPPGKLLVYKGSNSIWGYADGYEYFSGDVSSIMKAFETGSSVHSCGDGGADHHDPHKHDCPHDKEQSKGVEEHHKCGHEKEEEWDPEGHDADMYEMFDGLSGANAPALLTRFDLSVHKTATDLGGGSGALAFQLAKSYPGMKVKVMEQPNVIKVIKKYFLPGKESLGVSLVAGDFVKTAIAKSDLFMLSEVAHHWDDKLMDTMLDKIFKATNPGGGIMFFEKCLNDNKDGPTPAVVRDVAWISHGIAARSKKEFQNVLEKQGYIDVQIATTQDECFYDVIYARKPGSK